MERLHQIEIETEAETDGQKARAQRGTLICCDFALYSYLHRFNLRLIFLTVLVDIAPETFLLFRRIAKETQHPWAKQ